MGVRQDTLAHLYSVEVSPAVGTSTGCVRAATHPDDLVANFCDFPAKNCYGIFRRGKRISNDGPCVGLRPRDPKTGELASEYKFFKYSEIEDMGKRIGAYLLDNGAICMREFPEESYPPARRIGGLGIFSKTRMEWFTLELACNYYGIVIVPIYDTLGMEATQFILNQSKLAAIAVGGEVVDGLIQTLSTCKPDEPHYIEHVIVLDPISAEQTQKLRGLNVQIHQYADLLNYEQKADADAEGKPQLEDVYTICYTSGTTGRPKGVIITHGNIVANVAGVIRGPLQWAEMLVGPGDIHVSYLPLAHVFERAITNVAFGSGAAVGVYSGDTFKLLDDIRALKPTIFCSVPRLFNKINDRVFASAKEKNAVQQMLFKTAVNAKLKNVQTNGTVTHKLWDAVVFNKIRDLLGGRLSFMLVGGAPMEAAVQDNMKIMFSAYLSEGYGMSESLGTSFLAHPKDPVSGHVGGPIPCVEARVESVPEMDYYASDQPQPRGELCLRGPAISPGYFLNPEETAQSFDASGWLHTGDIVAFLESGAVKIIDRRKNMFKLAQGEYVAPERIEGAYVQAPLVGQIFVCGYSSKYFPVAVVVPDEDAARRWAEQNGLKGKSLAELCAMEEFEQSVVAEMAEAGKQLKGFEKVKGIHLSPEPFDDKVNGLLTPTFKLKRHLAAKHFKQQIDDIYARCKKA